MFYFKIGGEIMKKKDRKGKGQKIPKLPPAPEGGVKSEHSKCCGLPVQLSQKGGVRFDECPCGRPHHPMIMK